MRALGFGVGVGFRIKDWGVTFLGGMSCAKKFDFLGFVGRRKLRALDLA